MYNANLGNFDGTQEAESPKLQLHGKQTAPKTSRVNVNDDLKASKKRTNNPVREANFLTV